MNRIVPIALFTFLTVVAQLAHSVCPKFHKDAKWLFGAHVSAFRPDEERLRSIYGSTWLNTQLYLGYSPLCSFDVIATGNYLRKSGKTIGGHNSTTIRMIPIGLELRYTYLTWGRCTLFAGAGPKYYLLKVITHGGFLKGHISDQGWGGTVNTGFTWTPRGNFFFDLFIAYSYQKMKKRSYGNNIEGLATKLGGIDAGGGIGWRF